MAFKDNILELIDFSDYFIIRHEIFSSVLKELRQWAFELLGYLIGIQIFHHKIEIYMFTIDFNGKLGYLIEIFCEEWLLGFTFDDWF